MISVIHKKQGFLKTLKYVLNKEKAEIISTGMAGTSAAILNKQFLAVASLNQSVVRKCAHIIVSIAASEQLSNSQYHQVTKEVLQDLGYLPTQELSPSTSQFIAVRHHDRDHEHIHIVASRVQHNGKSVSNSFDYFKAEVSTRRISAQLGLEIAPVSNNAVASRLKQEFGITVEVSRERQKSLKQVFNPHKTRTSKQIIRQAIAEAIIDSPTIPIFIERLEATNIAVLPKIKENRLLGLTYIHKDVKIAGYQVYKPYSWTKLQSEYGLTYDRQEDSEFIERARVKAIKILSNYSNSTEPVLDAVFASKQCQEVELNPPLLIPTEAKSEKEEKIEALSPQIFNQSLTPISAQSNLNNSQELSLIITNYMKAVDKEFIEGRKLRVELDKNILQVRRIAENTPVMQTNYTNGIWNEQLNILTPNEIQQIKHLQSLMQQKLPSKQKTNRDRDEVQKDVELL